MSGLFVLVGSFACVIVAYALVAVYGHIFVHGPIRNARKHLTFEDFAKEFQGTPYEEDAIRIAYEDLVGLAGHPILRSDHLWDTLSLDQDEADDVVEEQFKKLRIDKITSPSKVDTVEDYVKFWSYVLKSSRYPARPDDK